jgi:uncharacterized protein (TIGR02145 family)
LITFTGGSATQPYTFTYNINGGGNLTATTTSGNSVTVPVPTNLAGTFTYNLVSVTDGSSTACLRNVSASATVIVNPLPVPPVSGPPSICVNSTGTYSTDPGMSGYTWTVSSGGSVTAGANTSSVSVLWSATGARSLTVNYTDPNGCTAAAPTTYPVTVNLLPNPTISGINSVCTGVPTTYTTQPGNASYAWTVSAGGTITGGGQPGDNTVTVNWTTAGPNSVSVNYIVGTGCTAASPTPYNVTVNPSATPSVTSPVNPICVTSSTTYNTQSGMSGYTWTVSPGGTVVGGSSANVLTVMWHAAGPQFVTVNYTNGFGCPGVAPVQYNLLVNPLPVTTITEASGPVCQSVPKSYQVPADPGCNFNWSITPAGKGNILSGQGSNVISIDWQNYGAAVLSVTGTNNSTGCLSSSTFAADVKPRPEPTFTPCFDVVTTPGAKKIILRGGSPSMPAQGAFTGNRVSFNVLTGNYEFDPSGASAGSYPVTYTYTNTYGCPASAGPVTISVQNSPFFCGGDLTDVRDGKKYRTSMIAGRCWMTQNLAAGTALVSAPVPHQTDNCIAEKYCAPNDMTCSSYGGLYQWDEIMDYTAAPGAKGICPPEWHLPTEAEWQQLIDNLIAGITAPDANATVAPDLKAPFLTGGFHALTGGLNYQDNTWKFHSGTVTGTMFWTSSSGGSERAVARGLNVFTPSISKYVSGRANAFSVRCVKD